jgi:hypothetical protein
VSNRWTRYQNRRMANRSETGGSDAHYLPSAGSSYTYFEGATAEDLRASILAGKTAAGGHVYSPLLIFGLAYEVLMKRLPTRALPAERSQAWPLSAAYVSPAIVTTSTPSTARAVKRIEPEIIEQNTSPLPDSVDFQQYKTEPLKTAVH